jgi:DNA-binding NtrC family response regulator
VLEQLLLRSDTGVIDAEEVAQVLRLSGLSDISPASPLSAVDAEGGAWASGDRLAQAPDLQRPLAQQVEELERRAVAAALQATQGNKVAAARMLGLSRAKLYQRLP